MPCPETMLFSLHFDSPGRIGAPPVNEIGYPGYARVLAERAQPAYLGWTLAGRPVSAESPVRINFPPASGIGIYVAKSWGACSADGVLIFAGTLHPPITISDRVTPQINAASLDEISRVIEENLRVVVKLLTTDEAAKLKECVDSSIHLAEIDSLFEAPDGTALKAAIDRVTAPPHGS